MKLKTKNRLSLISNVIIIALVAYSLVCYFVGGGIWDTPAVGSECLIYFTTLSNVFCAFTCLIFLIYNLRRKGVPKSVRTFKFTGTVSVAVTFTTVVCFLAPLAGYREMFEGINLFLHGICPLLAIISTVFFDGALEERRLRREPVTKRGALWGMVPTVLYSMLYFHMVMVDKWWDDFYSFNSGPMEGRWWLSIIIMYLGTYILLRLIWRAQMAASEQK